MSYLKRITGKNIKKNTASGAELSRTAIIKTPNRTTNTGISSDTFEKKDKTTLN